jgi:integrase
MIRPKGTSLEVRVYAGMVDGKRRYVYRRVKWQGSKKATERAAEQVLTQLLAEVDQGGHTGPDALYSALIERWWQVAVPDWSPSTASSYRYLLDGRILPELGAKRIRHISTEDLDVYYGRLRAEVGPTSITKIHSVIRSSLAQAVRWGWLPRNPADDARPPRVTKRRIEPPTTSDVDRILAAFIDLDPDVYVYLRLAVVTGARRGELLALRWSVISGDSIMIQASHVRGMNGPVTREQTKSRRDRKVWVDTGTAAELVAMHRRHLEEAMACGARLGPDAFVFSREPDGAQPWKPDSTSQRFSRMRGRLGLTCRIHDLRHYVATQLIGEGVSIPDVSKILGHANPAVTAAIYAHSIEENRAGAGNIMGAKLAKRPG